MDNNLHRVNVIEQGERLVVERRWLGSTSVGVVAFAVVWNVFLVLYAAQLASSATVGEEAVLLIPLTIVGVVTAYLALATLLNRTRVTVDHERLSITHHPLPWRSKQFERSALQQTVVRRYNATSNSQRQITYALLALLKDGTRRRLIGDLRQPNDAMFIKEAIHRHLGIDPTPMADEYR